MKDGKVKSIGSFDKLRAENPEFQRLVKLGELGTTSVTL